MAKQTTNLGLVKPLASEHYSIDIFNDNADLIDTAIKEIRDQLVKDSDYAVGGEGSNGAVWGYIPLVKTDGGIELGKYIDFHLTSNDGIDRYSRIMISSGEDQPIFTFSGSSSSEGAIIKADQVHANQYHGTYYGTLGYPAKITLNGVEFSYAATNASASSFADGLIFYAPTTAGEKNQILIADSDGKPTWTDSAPLATAFKTGDVTITFAQFYAAFSSALTTLQKTAARAAEPRIRAIIDTSALADFLPGGYIVGDAFIWLGGEINSTCFGTIPNRAIFVAKSTNMVGVWSYDSPNCVNQFTDSGINDFTMF